jgi:hypothetical protein
VIDRAALLVLELELEVALFGDLLGRVAGLRVALEVLAHHGFGLDIELGRHEALGAVEIEVFAVLDALKNFVRLGVNSIC